MVNLKRFYNYYTFILIFLMGLNSSGCKQTQPSKLESTKISISVVNSLIFENLSANGVIRFKRTGDLKKVVNLTYQVLGNAVAETDYISLNKKIVFAKDVAQVDLNIVGINNATFDGAKNLQIKIVASKDFTVSGNDIADLQIADDELPTVVLSQAGDTVTEGSPAGIVLTWTIPPAIHKDLRVPVYIDDPTLVQSFSPIPLSITIPKGSVSTNLLVTAVDNNVIELGRSIWIWAEPSAEFTTNAGNDDYAYISVNDNDFGFYLNIADGYAAEADLDPGKFRIYRMGATSTDYTVRFTVSGSATPGIDYTTIPDSVVVPASATYVDIPLTVLQDSLLEISESVTLTLIASSDFAISTKPETIPIVDNEGTVENSVVKLSSTTLESPPTITVEFASEPLGPGYSVYRKNKDATNWGTAIATLAAGTTHYIDTNVTIGKSYEYKVDRAGTGVGYIYSGIKVPFVSNNGKVILIVDSSLASSLITEIQTLIMDLESEGWSVIRHDVGRTDAVTQVKALIVSDYNTNVSQVKSVLILGHVPVPYSGILSPDGHGDHYGAWPTDSYYGDIDGLWTDATANTVLAPCDANKNIPGDGKFDQATIPSDLELAVGRVDLANMTAFAPKTETDLVRQYLNKNHSFRKGLITVPRRALIDDNFGYFYGETFASSGWSSFSPIVAPANVSELDWFTTLPTNNYLFAYGDGPGTYVSSGGVGDTTQFSTTASNAVFTMLFGSYFGDWDSTNNFLRAPLANEGLGLSNGWSGRAKWYFHQMGLGETLGYSAKKSQNNLNTYSGNFPTRGIQMNLMGDPTLKAFVVLPISDLTASQSGNTINISWTASLDSVEGYHIYVRKTGELLYTKVTNTMLDSTTTNYSYSNATTNNYEIMVRAVKLETTASGTFYNMSSGEKVTLVIN